MRSEVGPGEVRASPSSLRGGEGCGGPPRRYRDGVRGARRDGGGRGEVAPQPTGAERPADTRNPKGDRVVDEHAGGRLGEGCAVEDQHAGEPSLEDADGAGNGDHVGEVADDVPEDQDRQRWAVGGG